MRLHIVSRSNITNDNYDCISFSNCSFLQISKSYFRRLAFRIMLITTFLYEEQWRNKRKSIDSSSVCLMTRVGLEPSYLHTFSTVYKIHCDLRLNQGCCVVGDRVNGFPSLNSPTIFILVYPLLFTQYCWWLILRC